MVQYGLMLNEMLSNTLKYAVTPAELVITISLQRITDGYLFSYCDNGINRHAAEEVQKAQGLGIKLIQLSARQIDGELDIRYRDGLNYTLRILNA